MSRGIGKAFIIPSQDVGVPGCQAVVGGDNNPRLSPLCSNENRGGHDNVILARSDETMTVAVSQLHHSTLELKKLDLGGSAAMSK